MMNKTLDTHNESEKRVPAMITEQAYDALQELTQLLKEEKGVRKMSFYEAASIAIVETAERKARAKQRREQTKAGFSRLVPHCYTPLQTNSRQQSGKYRPRREARH